MASSPGKDRTLIKGLGFHFEGEGATAQLIAWLGMGFMIVAFVLFIIVPAARLALRLAA